jgi:hypothetical protein
METLTDQFFRSSYQPLANAGMPIPEATAHARGYTQDLIQILEGLLKIWPDFSVRRSQPYPTVLDLKTSTPDAEKNKKRKELLGLVFAFFRRYALFCMGNMGWVRKVWKGYEALGT